MPNRKGQRPYRIWGAFDTETCNLQVRGVHRAYPVLYIFNDLHACSMDTYEVDDPREHIDFYRTEGIRAKELIWNLLAIAYSEDEYSETEKQLIRFVAEQSGVHHSTLLEMEHELTSLIEIDKEEEALKSSSPSTEVEEKLTLLEERKNTIMKGIDALISG